MHVDIRTIKNDAREFYCMLERDEFIASGETLRECDEKDTRFSYKKLDLEIINKTRVLIGLYLTMNNGYKILCNFHACICRIPLFEGKAMSSRETTAFS